MALHMLQTGRRDLVPHALQMLPNAEKVNTNNNVGLTPLQMAALNGDTNVVCYFLVGFPSFENYDFSTILLIFDNLIKKVSNLPALCISSTQGELYDRRKKFNFINW